MMKTGYSLAKSFCKILRHLRSPPSKDMAETQSTKISRNVESLQSPKPNGKVGIILGTTTSHKKGVANRKSNSSNAKMTKQSICSSSSSSKAAKSSPSVEKAAHATASKLCNGKSSDLQPLTSDRPLNSIQSLPSELEEDMPLSPTSCFPNGASTQGENGHRILEFTLSTPTSSPVAKQRPVQRVQESPVVRPLAIGHHGFGSDARCSSNHASEIFKLKNIINAQLTSIAEQRLTIDSQSNSLREFKEENEMLKLKLERSERRMTNLKGRTASGRPVARTHLYDPFLSPSEISPPKSTTTTALAAAAAAAAEAKKQHRPKNRTLQAKRKTNLSADPLLLKKARIGPLSSTPLKTSSQSGFSSPLPISKVKTNAAKQKQFQVPADHAYYRESADVGDVDCRSSDGRYKVETGSPRFASTSAKQSFSSIQSSSSTTKQSSSSSTTTKQSSSAKAVFPSHEEARYVGNEVDEKLRASSRSPALVDAPSAPSSSISSSLLIKNSSSSDDGAAAAAANMKIESHSLSQREDLKDIVVSSGKRRTESVTTTTTKSECDDDYDKQDDDEEDEKVDVKVSTLENEIKSTNRSKKKRQISSGGNESVSQLLGRLSAAPPSERIFRRRRMMGRMTRLQQQQQQPAAAAFQQKKVHIGAELEDFGKGIDCQIASTANPGNVGDYIFRSDEPYPFFVGDPNYFQGELSPKKSEKEQVEAPVFRNVVVVPSSCISSTPEQDKKCIKAEVECLDDDTFLNRHNKGEADEKRRKRWDIQRIRELRNNERLKLGKHSGYSVNWSDPNKKPDEVEGRAISTFFPDPDEIKFIEVADTVPVCTFGTFLPNVAWNLFKVPWSKKELNFLFPPSATGAASSPSAPASSPFDSPSAVPRRNAVSAFTASARHLAKGKTMSSASSSSLPKLHISSPSSSSASSKRRASATPSLKSNLKGHRHSYSASCHSSDRKIP